MAAALAITCGVLLLLPQVRHDDFVLGGASATVPWLAPLFSDSELVFGLYGAVVTAAAVGIVAVGEHLGRASLINVGYIMVSVLLFALYVGRVAGALPTALAVLLGGMLLILGAVGLERRRRDSLEAST